MPVICFLASNGCMFSGISGLTDCFTIANRWHEAAAGKNASPLFSTFLASPDGKPVQVNGGYCIVPDKAMAHAGNPDVVVVPSYLPNAELAPSHAGDMLSWIVRQYQNGAMIAALCTGTFVVAETGLLNHRLATTNWYFANLFRRRYPKVRLKPERLLTEDRGLVCSGSASAFYNLGLFVIEQFGSAELSATCAKAFLTDAGRRSQAAYTLFTVPKNHGDEAILNAQQWMAEHLTDGVSIESLANQAGISPRHFVRRFKQATGETPLACLQKMRIEKGKRILETTGANVDTVTAAIGYENSGTFRKLFKKYTGLSPREYRSQFSRMVRPGDGTR